MPGEIRPWLWPRNVLIALTAAAVGGWLLLASLSGPLKSDPLTLRPAKLPVAPGPAIATQSAGNAALPESPSPSPSSASPSPSAKPSAPAQRQVVAPPPPSPRVRLVAEAEASGNLLGQSRVRQVSQASGGAVVSLPDDPADGSVRFDITVPTSARYSVAVSYINATVLPTQTAVEVNDNSSILVSYPPTRNATTLGSVNLDLDLIAGFNRIEFSNSDATTPDLDRLIITLT